MLDAIETFFDYLAELMPTFIMTIVSFVISLFISFFLVFLTIPYIMESGRPDGAERSYGFVAAGKFIQIYPEFGAFKRLRMPRDF